MIESRVERLAEDVLAAHSMTGFPVDPMDLARREDIRLVPGPFGGRFDGRIEYRLREGSGRFYLFYAEEELPERPVTRVRFSISHELAHYFLPKHRQYLLSGEWLGSRHECVSSTQMEREADCFAAALLMPRPLFVPLVLKRTRRAGTLAYLAKLAEQVFQTSLTSTVCRYVKLNFRPCCVVLSQHGTVKWALKSEAMKQRAYGWVGVIPDGSVTGKLASGDLSAPHQGWVNTSAWFGEEVKGTIWEEVLPLDEPGLILTLLLAPERPPK